MIISYSYKKNLYLNITNRCTNSCTFCLKNFSWNFAGYNLKLEKEPTKEEVIKDVIKNYKGEKEIVFCGIGEPLLRIDDVLDISKELKKQFKVSLRVNTNGQAKLLYPKRNIARELSEVIDAISISLNAENGKKYNLLCRPEFSNAFPKIIEFIKECKEFLNTTVTIVNLPLVNVDKCRQISESLGVKFRVRDFLIPK